MIKKSLIICLVLLMIGCSTVSNDNQTITTNNCCSSSYTVRKPVEIIYEDITYTTVYEPKTYSTKRYVRKPYNKCEKEDLCK